MNLKKFQKALKEYVEEYKDNYEYSPDQGVPPFIEEELIESYLTKKDIIVNDKEIEEIVFFLEEIKDQSTQDVISGVADDSLSQMIRTIEDL